MNDSGDSNTGNNIQQRGADNKAIRGITYDAHSRNNHEMGVVSFAFFFSLVFFFILSISNSTLRAGGDVISFVIKFN
jgi:hypothetical protein